MELFRKSIYEVTITYTNPDRLPTIGLMARAEYKRLMDDVRHGVQKNSYKITLDNIEAEQLLPVSEIDIVTIVPVLEAANGK